jgi:testis-specific serine kinase
MIDSDYSLLIHRYRYEIENKSFKQTQITTTTSPIQKIETYTPTDRAVMARQNIALCATLGKGSYSKVKLAYDLNTKMKIAIKIIDRSMAPKDFQEKFLPRELALWPKVKHSNIIQMYRYIINEHKIFILLEYADNGDMLSFIQKTNQPVEEKCLKKWMKQICEAVEYLHSLTISHRDLKLENIILDSFNNIKLCDFGFAKEEEEGGESKNLSQTYCGSKAYASPVLF